MKDLFPNRFYKKIWFYLFLLGFLISLLAVLVYLYMDKLEPQNVYVLAGAGIAIILLGAIISFFSFREPEATLKTFRGEDTEITRGDLTKMSEQQLRETYSKVTGVPIQQLP